MLLQKRNPDGILQASETRAASVRHYFDSLDTRDLQTWLWLLHYSKKGEASPMTTTSTSQVRQNYHQDSEATINRQINLELYASYIYLPMSYYFDRDDVALKNFAKYFLHQSHEEREHAEKLMKLQNQ
ncbi:hypothetical protein H8959_011958 [Pygathrix nigripes]